MAVARTVVCFQHAGLLRGSLDDLLGHSEAGVQSPGALGVLLSLSLHSAFDKKHRTQTVTDLRETEKDAMARFCGHERGA